MSSIARLQAATSLGDVAELLGFKARPVSYILYKVPAETKYRTFQIAKRSGGQRTIQAPVRRLKVVQRRLSDLLLDCVDEINDARQRKDRAAHGFKRRRSIVTNARQHRNRRWVFNLDLEDFFLSINFGRVRGFFLKNRDFELNQDVATILAQIACNDNSLPQGSPCSPVISNLVANVLDMRLVKLASEAGCTYSRYADDLTFSTNRKAFPPEIALPIAEDGVSSHVWVPGEALKAQVENSGFRINALKTHLMYRASRQNVTGLVVNQKINARWEYRHNIRAMVDRLTKTGEFERLAMTQRDGRATFENRPGTLNELHGMLGFIDSIDHYNRSNASDSPPEKRSSREKVYRTFLMYSIFYAAGKPVVICEGDTDNVYLTHAIRSLAADFPELAAVLPGGKIRLNVRLYKYPDSSTARLLDLGGGSSGLAAFIASYKKVAKRFTAPDPAEPVLIVYDNDDGAKGVRNAIRNASNKAPTRDAPFVEVIKNLYAIPTPLTAGSDSSKIEDCFDAATKATEIEGKTFNDGNDFDTDKHYGKRVFAHRVVRSNAANINFEGFRPLLTNVGAAISAYKQSNPPPQPVG